jgi:hypothetical protein
MKVIIAGPRDYFVYGSVVDAVKKVTTSSGITISEIVSGGAKGVDSLGEQYAREHNIILKVFPADWDTHGKSAGPKRNGQMAAYADVLIALWNYKSIGTKNMIDQAKAAGLRVFIYRI